MRSFGKWPAFANLAPLVQAFVPVVVGRQDLARGDQCRGFVLMMLADFLAVAELKKGSGL